MHPDEPGTKYCFFSGLDMPGTTEQKNPRTVFVNSMSDLFHARVPLDFVRQVFEVMADTPQHTYQVLTKRARRLRQVADQLVWPGNLWMGVSVETAKELPRVDDLGQVPASVRFLSCEPLLGPLDGLHIVRARRAPGPGRHRRVHRIGRRRLRLSVSSYRIPQGSGSPGRDGLTLAYD
ncbi:DUF5131 family protein, partial [Streptomyces sp. NPDC056178]|uniref:DUF5131 family protein n=1 Tax=Streptomyces sp. NPDC056178 TaxID=3345735 RepID=UPI0035DD1619